MAVPSTAFSFALYHAGLTPLVSLTAKNSGAVSRPPSRASVRLDSPPGEWRIAIPELQPGEEVELTVEVAQVDRDGLERITQPQSAELVLELGSDRARAPLVLLSAWQWPVFPEALPALAAFVLKHDGIVRALVSESMLLERSAGQGPQGAGESRSLPERVAARLERLYRHLAETYAISYAEPLVTRHPSGAMYQDLRPPHRILYDRRDCLGEGTCIDLTLLLAGCLEGMGLAPLIFLNCDAGGTPAHAFLGVWCQSHGRLRPIVRDPVVLERAVSQGDLLLIETTGVCAGGRRLEFEQAISEARGHLTTGEMLVALDVAALRPPNGRVLPMETPLEPVVLRAHAEVAALGERLGNPMFETLHLLYGLIRAGGEVTCRVLAESGVSAPRVVEEVERILSQRRKDRPRGRTVGYDRCVSDAAETARSEGSTVVRECDLWWAILWSRSGAVREALEAAGCPQADLVPALDRICPHSRRTTTIA
ncbi:MAG: hypothetical protein KAY32_08210 [Candidatus Eisenbacteria sp.]|nr:hypothetical protein [Candidatus Eisenbacteria bacterium]